MDYNKNTFWISYDEDTNSSKYYIKLNGILVEVNKDVYYTMFNSYRKTRYETMKPKTVSLDFEFDEYVLYDFIGETINPMDDVNYHHLIHLIHEELSKLNHLDRAIIQSFFFEEKSTVEIMKDLGISQSKLQYRKTKVLKRLRALLMNQ